MEATRKYKKHFTPEEANRTLPLVRKIIDDIVSLYSDIIERRERLESVRERRHAGSAEGNLYSEELDQIETDLDKDIEKLRTYVEELEALGVELKDPAAGLLDFPSLMGGREVFLCWKMGESEVGHWHELDQGFSGRNSLLEESISSNETEDSDPAISDV